MRCEERPDWAAIQDIIERHEDLIGRMLYARQQRRGIRLSPEEIDIFLPVIEQATGQMKLARERTRDPTGLETYFSV